MVPVRWAAWVSAVGALVMACTETPELDFGPNAEDGSVDGTSWDATVDAGSPPFGTEGGADISPTTDAIGPSVDAGGDADSEAPPILDAGPDTGTPCGPSVDGGPQTTVGCCPTTPPVYCVDQACQHCTSGCAPLACPAGKFCCPLLKPGGQYKGAVCKDTPGC